ncbi:hypothetical protein HMPREF1548_06455 [Clostridium sp. KLE 1755]|nr:hypothetical protein HMPREF1548_06455 [Clostridium sp. KLE 1755]
MPSVSATVITCIFLSYSKHITVVPFSYMQKSFRRRTNINPTV